MINYQKKKSRERGSHRVEKGLDWVKFESEHRSKERTKDGDSKGESDREA